MTNSASQPNPKDDDLVARQGVGLGMDMSVAPPSDATGWQRCPDCGVWSKGEDRPACPNCGYVFGQEQLDAPAAALDAATLRAAHNLLETAGSVENARLALDRAAQER